MNKNPFTLEGKHILITGASSGIGRKVAITCSEMGASTILLARDSARLNEVRNASVHPDRHRVFSTDLTNDEQLVDTLHQLKDQISEIDAVIHCAGISSTYPLRSINEKKLQEHFDVNVKGALMLTKYLVSSKFKFIQANGSIIFMSSIMATVGEAGKSVYAMSKGALVAAMKSLAVELALKGIRVNSISPGVVVTPMSMASFYSKDEARLEKIKALHPLGLGTDDDVANACVYLASDASKWVTGTNLIVDGGYTAR